MRRPVGLPILVWLLCASASLDPCASLGADRTFPMEVVGQIRPDAYRSLAFGDTDHDGRGEVICVTDESDGFRFRIQEEQGNNFYTYEASGPFLVPYATGDLDRDGRAEIIGQCGMYLRLYESPDSSSYPSILAWSSPPLSNITGVTTVGDSDRDGAMEIIHSVNQFTGGASLVIFENTGDNSYAQVLNATFGSDDFQGEKLVSDLDLDGRMEIAFSGQHGVVYVLESPSDNVWNLTWTYADGPADGLAVEGGRDTDGDGTPEFFVFGCENAQWITKVFEATGDNQFALVGTLTQIDGASGLTYNALGDLDGVPPDEYVMCGNNHFWIYRYQGNGWQLIQQVPNPDHSPHLDLYAQDVNGNGRCEVFWGVEPYQGQNYHTVILEHPNDPAAVPKPGERATNLVGGFVLAPNPFQGETLIRREDDALASAAISPFLSSASPTVDGSEEVAIETFDAAGRCLESSRQRLFPGSSFCWRPKGLAPGSYWVRLRSPRTGPHGQRLRIVVR